MIDIVDDRLPNRYVQFVHRIGNVLVACSPGAGGRLIINTRVKRFSVRYHTHVYVSGRGAERMEKSPVRYFKFGNRRYIRLVPKHGKHLVKTRN